MWAKAQWLGACLVSARLGRKEGEGLECPAKVWFFPSSNGEPWIVPGYRSDVTKWGLWEIHRAGFLGRPSKGSGVDSAYSGGGITHSIIIPPDPQLPPLLAERLFQAGAAPGRV